MCLRSGSASHIRSKCTLTRRAGSCWLAFKSKAKRRRCHISRSYYALSCISTGRVDKSEGCASPFLIFAVFLFLLKPTHTAQALI